MVQCVIPARAQVPGASLAAAPIQRVWCDLLELLGGVSDGRSDQGRVHPVAAVLALAAAATVAGMKGYTAIAGWVADVPAVVLAELYMRAGVAPAGPPGRSTIWRVLTGTAAGALDAAVGAWLVSGLTGAYGREDGREDGRDESAVPVQVRLDGKTVRGAIDAEGSQLHLLAAPAGPAGPAGEAVVVAQAEVDGAKPRESVVARRLLAQIDLTGKVVTADALHTVKATAGLICSGGGQFVFPVKEDRRALFDALDALTWKDAPIAHRSLDKGHGRITTRTIQVLPAPAGLPFPHVSQVFLIERHVTATDGTPISAVAQLGVASPATDTDTATPADLARYVQGQCAPQFDHVLAFVLL